MPSADGILAWATTVANEWRSLAILWHVALAAVLGRALFVRGRLSQQHVAFLMVLPIVSVAAVAALTGNPFNGVMFAILALVLGRAALSVAPEPVKPASGQWVVVGAALLAFGSTYPHFLSADSWTTYLYAAPFGLLPCPTLSVVIGITLILDGLRSSAWSLPLAAAGILYGLIGVITLGVMIDVWLLLGAVLLAMSVRRLRERAEERLELTFFLF